MFWTLWLSAGACLQTPYPGSAGDQFAFQWYILAVEVQILF